MNRVLWLLGVMLLVACGRPADESAGSVQALRAGLLESDRTFARLSAEQGIAAAYDRFLADDAVQLQDGGAAIYGKPAILENIRAVIELAELSLTWEPLDAAVSAAGDLGYTWGNYVLNGVDELGEPYVIEGKYANVWRGSAGSSWRVVLDISNQNELDFGFLDEWEYSDASDFAPPVVP